MCRSETNGIPSLRKVTIMATGTRGDIQPFVAIGFALKKAGYSVRVMTLPSDTHAMLLDNFGLEHVPFGDDAEKSVRENQDLRKAMETGDTMAFFKALSESTETSGPIYCKAFYDELIAGGEENHPDLLLVSTLNVFYGLYAKHVLKIPTIEIKLNLALFDNPARAPIGLPTLPFGMHRFFLTKMFIPAGYRDCSTLHNIITNIISSQRDTGGAKTTSFSSSDDPSTTRIDDYLLCEHFVEAEVKYSRLLPALICQPQLFKNVLYPTLPSLQDLRLVGSAIIEKTDQMGEHAESFGNSCVKKKVEDFIAADIKRKPVYMGWGSMIRRSTHEMAIFAVEALLMSNQRGIILGGWAELSMEVLEEAVAAGKATNHALGEQIIQYAKENVIFVDKAPHEWLFPQVSVTVHHGGAGTLNAALRAGVPTIITPVFVDQFDHAYLVQHLGVGVGFEQQLQKINAKDLSKAITDTTKDPVMAKRAKEVANELQKENGCRAVLEEVEKYWRNDVITGKFSADIKDWKIATRERKSQKEKNSLRSRILLGSAMAVAIVAFVIK